VACLLEVLSHRGDDSLWGFRRKLHVSKFCFEVLDIDLRLLLCFCEFRLFSFLIDETFEGNKHLYIANHRRRVLSLRSLCLKRKLGNSRK